MVFTPVRQTATRRDTADDSAIAPWAYLAIALWLSSAAIAFWWFQARALSPFLPETAAWFDARELVDTLPGQLDLGADDGLVLVHFWDPDCACSAANAAHVNRILGDRAWPGLGLVVVSRSGDKAAAAKAFAQPVDAVIEAQDVAVDIPSSPAAAVIDASGELVFFGPYSIGARCLDASNRFVEDALARAAAGEAEPHLVTAAIGCFCAWDRADAVGA